MSGCRESLLGIRICLWPRARIHLYSVPTFVKIGLMIFSLKPNTLTVDELCNDGDGDFYILFIDYYKKYIRHMTEY